MSAAISHLPERPPASSVSPIHRTAAGRLRSGMRVLRSGRLPVLSLVLLLLWSFVGSLAMGLRTPATSDAGMARLWLAGAMAIALAGVVAGFLAGQGEDG